MERRKEKGPYMRVLIVDDEVYMLDYMKKLIDWEKFGFDQASFVRSGSLARDMLQKETPGLLITDIRMPKVSGMDLCRYIAENNLPVKVILLSGYGEFQYAQQAIRYGVSEYLLKPVVREDLEKAILRVIKNSPDKTGGKKSEDKIIERIQTYIEENICSDLSLENLGSYVYLNPSYLSRYYKETTGENLSSYITRCKMEKAAWFLKNTQKKISEIMLLLGYRKAQHFAGLFREQYGLSPKEYRRKEQME